jgi:hypothetical protein
MKTAQTNKPGKQSILKWCLKAATWMGLFAVLSPRLMAAEVTAKKSDDFVESIGVNVHWSYNNVYINSYAALKTKLGEAGIRHTRDGAVLPVYDKATDLFRTHGVRMTFLTGKRKDGPWPQQLDSTKIDAELNEIKTRALEATVAIEGPNEYDLMSKTIEPDWVTRLRDYQSKLAAKVRADPLLKDRLIVAPSICSPEASTKYGNQGAHTDTGCLHLYQSSRHPGNPGWGSNGYGSIDWAFKYFTDVTAPGKPVQSTECGYENSTGIQGISERIDGIYTLRMYAEFYRRGITRSFKYELVDQGTNKGDREQCFGLLRNDVTEKPSFKGVKNMITILKDATWDSTNRVWKKASFNLEKLDYTTAAPSSVRQMLFQKSDGNFYLMIWNEVPSVIPDRGAELNPAPVAVTLTFNTKIAEASINYPNDNASFTTKTLTANKLELSVPDRLMIVRLKPAPSNLAPTVAITSPVDGATIGKGTQVVIQAKASDPEGQLGQVEFYRGSTLLKRDTAAPYNVSWIASTEGANYFTAKARDSAGLSKTSQAVVLNVTATNLPPRVSFISPLNKATLPAGTTAAIEVKATDSDGGIKKVEFFRNGKWFHTENWYPYRFSWKPSAGSYTILAKAYDKAGAATSASITVTVKAL